MNFLKAIATSIILIVTIGILLFSCFATMTDAQGVFIFIFTLPVMVGAILLAFFLTANKAEPNKALLSARRATKILAGFLILFFVCAPIPKINKIFPGFIFSAISKNFESYTGKSPYAWVKDRHNLELMIDKVVATSSAPITDLSQIPNSGEWDKICFYPPYTANDAAQSLIQADFKLSDYSQIGHSDSITTIALLNGNRLQYIKDYPRGKTDFAEIGLRCIPRDKAKFSFYIDGNHRRIAKWAEAK